MEVKNPKQKAIAPFINNIICGLVPLYKTAIKNIANIPIKELKNNIGILKCILAPRSFLVILLLLINFPNISTSPQEVPV